MYIHLTDKEGKPVSGAAVTLISSEGKTSRLKFDADKNWYASTAKKKGTYSLRIAHKDFDLEIRTITPDDFQKRIDITLIRKGARFLRLSGGKLEIGDAVTRIELLPTATAVSLEHRPSEKMARQLRKIRQDEEKAAVFYLETSAADPDNSPGLNTALGLSGFSVNGLKIGEGDSAITLLRDVAFALPKELEDNYIIALLAGFGFAVTIEKPFVSGINKWFRTLYTGVISDQYIDLLNELSLHPDINEVVPDMITQEKPSSTPGDDLFGLQWSLHLSNVPAAWDLLYEKDPQLGFGSADVIVNVFDSGIQTTPFAPPPPPRLQVQVVHPDFNTTVSGGSLTAKIGNVNEKVYRTYDFSLNDPNGIAVQMLPDNNRANGSHGTCVSGVILAASGPAPGFPGIGLVGNEGTTGVSPNARLMSSAWDFNLSQQQRVEVFSYLQGFNPSWTAGSYTIGQNFPLSFNQPQNPGPGYYLSNHSHSYKAIPTFAPGSAMAVMIDSMVSFGRNRRGAFMLFASGNEDENISNAHARIAQHEKVIAVAGSSIGPKLVEERTSYSNFGAVVPAGGLNGPQEYAEIDFCAPTNHHAAFGGAVLGPHFFHFPPVNRGIFTADLMGNGVSDTVTGISIAALNITVNNGALFKAGDPILVGNIGGNQEFHNIYSVVGNTLNLYLAPSAGVAIGDRVLISSESNLPYSFTASNNLNGPFGAGLTAITVNSTAGFAAGMAVLIGSIPIYPGVNNCESGYIEQIAGNSITLRDPLKYDHLNNEPVRAGASANTDAFSGTSAACPFASGVLSLILSANPHLSFWEARNIMKSTAVPIDLRLTSPGGVLNVAWIDAAGLPVVDVNGLLNPGGGTTTVTAAVRQANPNRTRITLNSVAGFSVGQAILIGAESTATAAPAGTTVQLASSAGFAIGQQVEINSGPLTHLAIPANAAQNILYVGNINLFKVNQLITIGSGAASENHVIFAIIAGTGLGFGTETLFIQLVTNLGNNHPVNAPVTLANTEVKTIQNVNHGTNTLTLDSNLAFPHPIAPIPVVVRTVNAEIAVIRAISGNNIITEVLATLPVATTPVRGGLIPHYSHALGSGRLDAYEAVNQAINFNHDQRDLMIRNFMADDGKAAADPAENPIDSPPMFLFTPVSLTAEP